MAPLQNGQFLLISANLAWKPVQIDIDLLLTQQALLTSF